MEEVWVSQCGWSWIGIRKAEASNLVWMLGVAVATTFSYGIWVRAHLASKGLGEHLPVGAEGALRVVLKQVLKLSMGTVFTQHYMAPVS